MLFVEEDLHQDPFAGLKWHLLRPHAAVDAAGRVVAVGDVFDLNLEPAPLARSPAEEDAAVSQRRAADIRLEFAVAILGVADQVTVALLAQ